MTRSHIWVAAVSLVMVLCADEAGAKEFVKGEIAGNEAVDKELATKRAGELAGFKVERIISEPTAAAIAYGLYQNTDSAKYLVFDLGGGTFDVSILELNDNIIEVRAVAGDNYLGGEDFTRVIEDMFFDKNIQLDRSKLSYRTLRHIHKQAELCKIGFADGNSSRMICNVDGESIEFVLSLDAYEAACADLLEKMKTPIKRTLSDAHIKVKDIDKVVLIGGATKMSFIRRFVGKMFRNMPDTSINPDEAVALGAAIQGAMKERNEVIREVVLTDVCPFTLGTEVVVEKEENVYEGGHFCPIIERNTTIPTHKSQIFSTAADNQPSVDIHVLQGEREMAAGNKTLGRFELTDIPPAPRGVPKIEVSFDIDANGIVHVSAKDLGTGKEQKITIQSDSGMSKEDIDRMVNEAKAHEAEDKKQKEAIDAKNNADNLVYQAEKTIKELGDKADAGKVSEVKAACEKVKEAIKSNDTEAIKKATEAMQKPLYELSAAAYQQAQASGAQGAQGAQTGSENAQGAQQQKKDDDDVVDADYTEVKDDKK